MFERPFEKNERLSESSLETLLEIGKLPRDTTNTYEHMALLAYDRGCREGHGPYKSIAWDLAVEIYRQRA